MPREPSVSQLLAVLAVTFILTAVLLFGPLSPLSGDAERKGEYLTGNASVEIQTPPPESLEMRPAKYTDDQYVVEIPDVVVNVSDVSGQPILTYKVQMARLGQSKITIAELGPETTGPITLSHVPASVPGSRVRNDTYVANIFIILRGDDTQYIYRENVTIHVRE